MAMDDYRKNTTNDDVIPLFTPAWNYYRAKRRARYYERRYSHTHDIHDKIAADKQNAIAEAWQHIALREGIRLDGDE